MIVTRIIITTLFTILITKIFIGNPKEKTNWLQECLKKNARKCGCYTLNQQWQDEHKVEVETSAVIFLCLLFIYNFSVIAFCMHLFILSLLGFSHIFTIQKFCQSSHFITLSFILGSQNYVFVGEGWDAICVQNTPKIPFFPSLQKSGMRELPHRPLKEISLSSLAIGDIIELVMKNWD